MQTQLTGIVLCITFDVVKYIPYNEEQTHQDALQVAAVTGLPQRPIVHHSTQCAFSNNSREER